MNTFPSVLLVAVLALATWATPASSTAQTPPDDSKQLYLMTVTASNPTPQCQRLMQAMQHPEMQRIAAGCKVFHCTPDDEIYAARYARAFPPGDLPIVTLIRHDGGVLFKASGANGAIPDGETLAASMTQMASLDRQQNPRSGDADGSVRPWRTPDGGWNLPDRRPSLIPDTVVISPSVNVPAGLTSGLIIVAIIGLVTLLGFGVLVVIGAVFYFTS